MLQLKFVNTVNNSIATTTTIASNNNNATLITIFPIVGGETLVLGRRPELLLSDPLLSRRHVELVLKANETIVATQVFCFHSYFKIY